jgi:hypothetical protein
MTTRTCKICGNEYDDLMLHSCSIVIEKLKSNPTRSTDLTVYRLVSMLQNLPAGASIYMSDGRCGFELDKLTFCRGEGVVLFHGITSVVTPSEIVLWQRIHEDDSLK